MRPVFRALSTVTVASFILVACEGTLEKKDDPPVEDRSSSAGAGQATTDSSTSTAQPLPTQRRFEGHPLDDPDSLLATRVVYFDFDSSAIHPEDEPVIEAHAQYLANNPSAIVSLEGHADERGSREYNIGLGDRRGQAVRQAMELLGAAPGQLRNVSYGEERPAVLGHNEAAWSKNRRVEFNYVAR
jgi:peptidoglycan-associated lipoprotein